MNDFLSDELQSHQVTRGVEAGKKLAARLLRHRQVGDLLKLDYNEATIVVHDKLRREVGGLPLGCFLIATRVEPGSEPDPNEEDTSFILMRVLGPSHLPNQLDTDRDRFEAAKRAADRTQQWDDQTTTDQFTLNLLRFAGLRCRILGTFLLKADKAGNWETTFGPDLANFYSGRGMKVYKPDGDTLADIVNYVRPHTYRKPGASTRIAIGRVRYAASERPGDDTLATRVNLDPADLLARRTALFGMSRTGKSNTTKIVAAAVFRLRGNAQNLRVGQLILDPNGEYANDNAQDAGSLRRVGSEAAGARAGDVVTYGLNPHPNDPNRRIVKLNFFGTEPKNWEVRADVVGALTPLIEGKEVIGGVLAGETRRYMTAFCNVSLNVPEDWEGDSNRGDRVRYKRVVMAYRALLAKCGFTPPQSMRQCVLNNLTNDTLRKALASNSDYASAATTFGQASVAWDAAFAAFRSLGLAIKETGASVYKRFDDQYAQTRDGRRWHDADLEAVLAFMDQRGGLAVLGSLAETHDPQTSTDYADDIVADLREGRLVIVDQSTGDPNLNKSASERLMWRIFNRQKRDFIQPRVAEDGSIVPPPDVLVYVEEAHNLLPAKSDDLTTVWSRVAKEGSKFCIGLAYATQEPSSIQANILKNTDNWFVAHLNNADELREIKKYYDFEDFAQQVLTVPEPGFIRMRTLSNPYTVPVQIDRFAMEG